MPKRTDDQQNQINKLAERYNAIEGLKLGDDYKAARKKASKAYDLASDKYDSKDVSNATLDTYLENAEKHIAALEKGVKFLMQEDLKKWKKEYKNLLDTTKGDPALVTEYQKLQKMVNDLPNNAKKCYEMMAKFEGNIKLSFSEIYDRIVAQVDIENDPTLKLLLLDTRRLHNDGSTNAIVTLRNIAAENEVDLMPNVKQKQKVVEKQPQKIEKEKVVEPKSESNHASLESRWNAALERAKVAKNHCATQKLWTKKFLESPDVEFNKIVDIMEKDSSNVTEGEVKELEGFVEDFEKAVERIDPKFKSEPVAAATPSRARQPAATTTTVRGREQQPTNTTTTAVRDTSRSRSRSQSREPSKDRSGAAGPSGLSEATQWSYLKECMDVMKKAPVGEAVRARRKEAEALVNKDPHEPGDMAKVVEFLDNNQGTLNQRPATMEKFEQVKAAQAEQNAVAVVKDINDCAFNIDGKNRKLPPFQRQ